ETRASEAQVGLQAVDFDIAGACWGANALAQDAKGRAARAGKVLAASAGISGADGVPEGFSVGAQRAGGARTVVTKTVVGGGVVGAGGEVGDDGDEIIAGVAGVGAHLGETRPAINPIIGYGVISLGILLPDDLEGLVG